jgi:hypothetical protein
MLDDALLKLANALTPDDVKEMVSLGLEDKLAELFWVIDKMVFDWRNHGLMTDSKAWTNVNIKLNELRAAWREAKSFEKL